MWCDLYQVAVVAALRDLGGRAAASRIAHRLGFSGSCDYILIIDVARCLQHLGLVHRVYHGLMARDPNQNIGGASRQVIVLRSDHPALIA